jgi:hypothetical protein
MIITHLSFPERTLHVSPSQFPSFLQYINICLFKYTYKTYEVSHKYALFSSLLLLVKFGVSTAEYRRCRSSGM